MLELTHNLNGDSKTLINNSLSMNSELYDHKYNCNNDKESSNFYANCDKDSTDNESFDPSYKEDSAKSVDYGSDSNFKMEQDFIKNNFFGTCFCDKCHKLCFVDIMDNLELKFICGCTYIEGINILEFIKDYLKKEEEQPKDFKIYCPYHKEETEFLKYCTDCEQDLCKECLNKNTELYSNTSKSYKAHENHTLVDLSNIISKLKEIEKLIDKCEKGYVFLEVSMKNKLKNVFIVIRSIIENYKKYKNYYSVKSIENAEKFLIKIINQEEYNFKFSTEKGKYINLKRQTSAENFETNIKHHSEQIRDISLKYIEEKGQINFSLLNNINFINLKELIIRGMKFNDISPLLSCKFPALEHIDFEKNSIDNTIIIFLEKLDSTELKVLNLFKNNITDEKIFYVVNKFKKLNIFFLGENPIKFDPNFKGKYEFPKSVDEFGMTGNLDPIKANYIKRLEINYLKIFYISRNNIDNLEYIKDIEFFRLIEFWAVSNKITDIKQLMYIKGKQNLEIINLKENQIKNFNELIDIIKDFPKLKKLNLKDNNIPEKEAVEMKKKIKEIYNHDLEIIV